MSPQDPRTFADRLIDAITDGPMFESSAAATLSRYLSDYDGRRFHDYDLAHSPADRITPGDLVAVTSLSMDIGSRTSSGITPKMAFDVESTGPRITELLRLIPTDRELHTLESEEFERWLGDGSPADKLWKHLRQTLCDERASRRVAAYKLLARKRPHLFAIRDSASERALSSGDAWWRPWWEALSSRPDIVERLAGLRADLDIPELSLLRVADIIIWMRFNKPSPARARRGAS